MVDYKSAFLLASPFNEHSSGMLIVSVTMALRTVDLLDRKCVKLTDLLLQQVLSLPHHHCVLSP